MDPVQRLWYQNNWIQDSNDQAELAKNTAYLIASFINPEAVKKMLAANTHVSSDDEFEESLKIVEKASANVSKKRKHKKLKE